MIVPVIEKTFALIVLLACAGLLLRMMLPPARRDAWDRFWQRLWWRLRTTATALGLALQGTWRRLRGGRSAQREAADVIARAQGKSRKPHAAERDGNVIRPHRFGKGGRGAERGSDDDRTLH